MSRSLRLCAVPFALATLIACWHAHRRTDKPGDISYMCASPTPTPSHDSQFPLGFDYPQKTSDWVHPSGGHRARLHAWCLFAGLNTPAQVDGRPGLHWQNWGTSTQAFPIQYLPWPKKGGGTLERPAPLNAKNVANAEVGGVGAINNPAPIYGVNQAIVDNPRYQQCLQPIGNTGLFQLKDGEHLQSNGDIMVAGVIYNQAALQWILDQRLFDASKLDAGLPAPTATPTPIPSFPTASIVLKPMFWPVQRDGYTALPIWDWDAPGNLPGQSNDGRYAGYEIQAFWKRAAAVSNRTNPPSSVTFLFGVRDSNGNPLPSNTYTYSSQISPPPLTLVGLDRFYHRTYEQADLDKLSPCDRAILDASAYWAYNREFLPGDSLVLVAMHIMTREQDTWTFQSAWWHPDALQCGGDRYCGQRPTNLADTTFQNYNITTTYGMTQQTPGHDNYYKPPNTKGAILPVAYNPYIELAASHPITTNCMNCHHRAAWPPRLELDKPDPKDNKYSSYLQTTQDNPNVLEVFDLSNPNDPNLHVFDGLLTLDSMWAISDRAAYPDVPQAATATKNP